MRTPARKLGISLANKGFFSHSTRLPGLSTAMLCAVDGEGETRPEPRFTASCLVMRGGRVLVEAELFFSGCNIAAIAVIAVIAIRLRLECTFVWYVCT